MKQDARPIPTTIYSCTVTYAECALCGGRIIERPTTPGFSRNYGHWEHQTGSAIPNYACSPQTGPRFKPENTPQQG